MATYRQVHISYWQDPFIESLDIIKRYFYLYLMTNSKEMERLGKKYETRINKVFKWLD